MEQGIRINSNKRNIDFINYLLAEGYANTVKEAELIEMAASDEWFYSVIEARQPISRNARERIADIASADYSYNPKGKARANKLVNSLSDYDKNRGKRELPVGRMARKLRTLQSRPQVGADKEKDYARAEDIERSLRD